MFSTEIAENWQTFSTSYDPSRPVSLIVGAVAAFVPFAFSAYALTYAAWPRCTGSLRAITSVPLAGALWTAHYLAPLLLGANAPLVRIVLWALLWVGIAAIIYSSYGYTLFGFSFKRRRLGGRGSAADKVVAFVGLGLILGSLLLIPMLGGLDYDPASRLGAYFLALLGIVFLGAATKSKSKAALGGFFLLLALSLLAWAMGRYPVCTPLSRSGATIQQGLEQLSGSGLWPMYGFSGLISSLGFVIDLSVCLTVCVLIGVAAVVGVNALLRPADARAPAALVAAVALGVTAIFGTYVYLVGVSALEYGSSMASGVFEAVSAVETLQQDGLDPSTIDSAFDSLSSSSTHLNLSTLILKGLEKLHVFQLASLAIYQRIDGSDFEHLAWGLTDGARGLVISGMGVVTTLNVTYLLLSPGGEEFSPYDILGPSIIEGTLPPERVRQALLRMDEGFGQVSLGFPLLRSSARNLSQVDFQHLASESPSPGEQLVEFEDLGEQIDAAVDVLEVLLSPSDGLSPATSLLFALYSLSQDAREYYDLRDPDRLPGMEEVRGNLSVVANSLLDPKFVQAQNTGGGVAGATKFLSDVVEIVDGITDLASSTREVAIRLEDLTERFSSVNLSEVSDAELYELQDISEEAVRESEQLGDRAASLENRISQMMQAANSGGYGYANELAVVSSNSLQQILDYLVLAREVSEFSSGVSALVSSSRSFRDLGLGFDRLQREIASGSWGAAEETVSNLSLNLFEGRIRVETLLTKLEALSGKVKLPITQEQVQGIVDVSSSIQLKLDSLRELIRAQDAPACIQVMEEMRQDYLTLEQLIRLRD